MLVKIKRRRLIDNAQVIYDTDKEQRQVYPFNLDRYYSIFRLQLDSS